MALAGFALWAMRKLPRETMRPFTAFAVMFVFFMTFIATNGVYYAGLRHWLFAVPLMSLFAACAALYFVSARAACVVMMPVIALWCIAIPGLSQPRAWEYHNLIAGGTYNAWKYFDNESVDLGQRSDEIAAFYQTHIQPETPLYGYWTMREQRIAEGIPEWNPTPEEVNDGYMSGWFIFTAPNMPMENWRHIEVFRTLTPTARIGNAALFHGRFYLPYGCGGILIGQAMRELDKLNGDRKKAELYLRRGVALNDEATDAFVELSNFSLEHNDKTERLQMLRAALKAEIESEQVRQMIREKIAAVEQGDTTPMRRLRLE